MCSGEERALGSTAGVSTEGLTKSVLCIALTMTDVPKKNKKGKRVA